MTMTSDDLKRVFTRYQDLLELHRDKINGLNVYPVPDGDTGSNLFATVMAVNGQLRNATSMQDVGRGIADGSLRGATGPSGLILSLILRGLSAPLAETPTFGPSDFAAGLTEGAAQAYLQVGDPMEGTMLTVVREAAEEAMRSAANGTDWPEFLDAVYRRAVDALERTPQMLRILDKAGVVDAGGAGVVLLLAAFLADRTGSELSLPAHILAMSANLDALDVSGQPVTTALRYEVMFFLDSDDEMIPTLRERWAGLGDSIVVVGGDGEWNCHIHTDEIGAAIEAGIAVGQPRGIQVTDLQEQVGSHSASGSGHFVPGFEAAVAPIGVVSVLAGDGLVELFRSLWVQGVVVGGQSMNPSAEDLLKVIDAVPANKVIVLPNNKNVVPVAEQLDALTTKDVIVVPTRSIPQGVAAMMGYSTGEESLHDAAQTMSAAASSIISAEVTRAVRNAKVEGLGEISQGDWIGIVDGTPIVSHADPWIAISTLVRRIMTAPLELVTIYAGAESDPGVTSALSEWIQAEYPLTEVTVVEGGQPLFPYLLSFE